MRGEKEQSCLDIVREKYSVESCYALSHEECDRIEAYFKTATPNPTGSNFPDFIFADGFIEHFQISSSHENRRGAIHIKEEAMFNRESELKEADFKANFVNTQNEVKGINSIFGYPEHSYDNLVRSFKAHWSNHIESLENMPQYNRKCGIFMIQYCDMAIEMLENIFQNSKVGLSLPIRKQQYFHDYKLSRDKELLQHIAEYKDIIHYVIYVNSQEVEIISTCNVEEIIKLLPWDFFIAPKFVLKRRAVYGISILTELSEVTDDE